MFKQRRKLLSQNFLKNRKLVTKLLACTSIEKKDTVLDIGAGKGIITEELSKSAGKIFAIEKDKKLANSLSKLFKFKKSVIVLNMDFRNFYLPKGNYKVFSNIPFVLTSDIIKKLIFADNPPQDAYLIVQKEAAEKFIVNRLNKRNSQISILIYPFFDLSIIYKFNRSDFHPRPKVDTVLLHIERRDKPLVNLGNKNFYQDFIVYAFNQTKPNFAEGLSDLFGRKEIQKLSEEIGFSTKSKPSEIPSRHWIKLFEYFEKNVKNKNKVIDSFRKQLNHQSNLEKIHRTRSDKNWKNQEG